MDTGDASSSKPAGRKWHVVWFGVVGMLLLAALAHAGDYSLYEPVRIVARPDYSLGFVFLERWRGDYFLGVDRVIPLDEYLKYQLAESMTESWQDKARRSQEQKELAADASGLIPDIQLPKLPIFGEGSKIDISGKDRITLGGRQTFVRGIVRRPGDTGLFPELKMEQQLSVILNGTVGERTKVNIDHDSEREEGQNKVMLSYTGTEDEVVQSIELGDTKLTIPGTIYTGDLPAHKGLFGASARGKLAGVDVYGIASREQSQSQTQSFTGQRRLSTDTIYDVDYVTRRFYHIPVEGTIRTLQVYVDDRNPGNNQSAYAGIATVFPNNPDSLPDSVSWSYDRAPGDFDLKSYGKDYYLHPGNIIEFANAFLGQEIVGLAVRTDHDSFGGYAYRGDTLVMMMLKPQLPDSQSLTWNYEMRNVYQLPQGDVTLNSLQLFRYDPQEGENPDRETGGANTGLKFIQFLGLDPNGDGRIEYPEFESKTGLIQFPGARPFDSSALSVRDPIIYHKDPSRILPGEGRRYFLVAEYSSATESYYLGQPDITEGSEKVTVNGDVWVRDQGYSIDYKTGVLKFLTPLPTNASIQVTFEYQPLFSLAQKSLMGTRAELNLSQQGKVGASVFYRSEGIPEDKPALGSEPFRRMIAEADASYSATSNGVSAFLDRLPLLRAQAPTTFSAAAEGAVSLPDPNTRGVAYLDDFEGTTITRDVSITSILWSWASVPDGEDTTNFARTPMFWTNPTDKVRNDSVFGPAIGDEGRETHDYLRAIFTPDSAAPETSWAGIMTSPSPQIGMNLKDVEDLRMILKTRQRKGMIHVSVGLSIDEDAPRRDRAGRIVGRDGRENTEDRNHNGQLDDATEDTGLDTIFGADSLWTSSSADDGDDDYDAVTNPMGTEDNRRLDGEDLDQSGFSMYNHYFECAIPLGDPRFFSSLHGAWQLCRVPLMDTTAFRTVGQPRWEDIRLVRVWFDGFDAQDTIDFYSIEFTGSRWTNPQLTLAKDTNVVPVDTNEKTFVTQVSKKTDTSYTSPFDLKRDAQGVTEQEASLLLGYRNLYGNRRAIISKASTDREDYRDYSGLRLYVHDDGNSLAFLVRLGSDSVNYYEFRSRITDGMLVPGRDGKWYEFLLKLDSLPLLKVERDSASDSLGLWRSGPYAVVGRPSLADVRYTALGLENTGTRKITGGIWFDDMRLVSPRKEPGYGFQARTNVALSDFAAVGLTFGYSDPNFRRFSEDRGVKTGGFGTSVAANARANLDRLLPHGWGLSLPLTYSVSEQRDLPKFSAIYPDLRLTREAAAGQLSSGRSEDLSLDNIRKTKSGSPLLNYTLEAMGASWRQHRGESRSALGSDSSWSGTAQWSYDVSPDLKVKLGQDNELSLFPQTVRFGLTDGRSSSFRGSRLSPDSAMRVDTLRGHGLSTDFGLEYSPLEDLSFDYSVETDRDLLVPSDSLWFLKLGSEASRDHSFNASYNIDVGDILSPSLDFSGDYSDDRAKEDTTYADVRNMTNSGDLDFTLGVDLPEILGKFEPSPAKAPAPKPVKPDTTREDSTGRKLEAPKPSHPGFRIDMGALSQVFQAIDISYSISRNSDLVAVFNTAPWYYRLGFVDAFPFDSLRPPTSAARERRNSLRLSSGARVRELSADVSYDWSEGRNFNNVLASAVLDRSTTWPNVTLTLDKVHNLFKNYATDSKLSTSFKRRSDLGGEVIRDSTGEHLNTYGLTESNSNEMSPLVSWQTTWKRRITTTLSANYTFGTSVNYLSEDGLSRSVVDSRDEGLNLSLSYAFSAPQGLRLPFLKRLRFSSDLSLTWSLRYSQTLRVQTPYTASGPGTSVEQQHDNTAGTDVAASYRFSRSIEAGLTTGYTSSKNRIAGTTTETMNLDFWVLFRF